MNSTASKMGFKKEKYESKLLRLLLHHRLSWQFIVAFGLNKKVSCEGLLGGGGIQSILKHLYLNDYAEFYSKISYIMFLHDYLLACEISTVRTFAFSRDECIFYNIIGFKCYSSKRINWIQITSLNSFHRFGSEACSLFFIPYLFAPCNPEAIYSTKLRKIPLHLFLMKSVRNVTDVKHADLIFMFLL